MISREPLHVYDIDCQYGGNFFKVNVKIAASKFHLIPLRPKLQKKTTKKNM